MRGSWESLATPRGHFIDHNGDLQEKMSGCFRLFSLTAFQFPNKAIQYIMRTL